MGQKHGITNQRECPRGLTGGGISRAHDDLADTERLTDGLGDEAKSHSLSTEHPLTGKPEAGNPPVRFGGRGAVIRSPYPYIVDRGMIGSEGRRCDIVPGLKRT